MKENETSEWISEWANIGEHIPTDEQNMKVIEIVLFRLSAHDQ